MTDRSRLRLYPPIEVLLPRASWGETRSSIPNKNRPSCTEGIIVATVAKCQLYSGLFPNGRCPRSECCGRLDIAGWDRRGRPVMLRYTDDGYVSVDITPGFRLDEGCNDTHMFALTPWWLRLFALTPGWLRRLSGYNGWW